MPLLKEKPVSDEVYYTLEDALEWDEGKRIELINGVPMMMSAPLRIHQEICGELFSQLHNYLREKKCRVYAAPFAVRPFEKISDKPKDVNTMVEPDITVVCDPDKLDRIGCRGAPDLIIEILSPSSQQHDRLTKFNLYQRAGVREYWLVDPNLGTAQSFVLKDGYFAATGFGQYGDEMKVHVLDGCTINLSAVFPEPADEN